MAFKDLYILKEKEYRLFLVLFIWLLLGYTLFQFFPYLLGVFVGVFIFLPLLGFCQVLFIASLITKKDPKDFSKLRLILYLLLSFPVMFALIGIASILFLFMLVFSMFFYIFLTTIFTLRIYFDKGVKFDDRLFKLPSPLNFFVRTLVLFLCLGISAFLMLVFYIIGAIFGYEDIAISIFLLTLICFGLLMFLTFILLLTGRYNAWIGIFFVFGAIYSIYLAFKAFVNVGGPGGGLPIIILAPLYLFDLYLLLTTMGGLMSKREVLADKLHLNSNLIIILLILSKASYTFAEALGGSGPDDGITPLKIIAFFYFFIPLFFLTGLFGIYRYGQIKKVRISKQKREKVVKRAKREGTFTKNAEYCFECGFPNKENSKYCKKCGEKIYIRTRTAQKLYICPKCETENPRESKFCKKCGFKIALDTSLPEDVAFCIICGDSILETDKFCPICGSLQNGPSAPTLIMEEKIICPRCQTANRSGSNFCKRCALKLS